MLGEDGDVPALFRGINLSELGVRELETAQRTFNEQLIYEAMAGRAAKWAEASRHPANVLDLCSANGLASSRVAKEIEVATLILVDRSLQALSCAERPGGVRSFVRIASDAAICTLNSRFDLILANSAYHHIEDQKKVDFLRRARSHLTKYGQLLMGDHFLPSYGCQDEFKSAVTIFYERLIAELHQRNEDAAAIEIIRQAAYLCWAQKEEFKVSWEVFKDDVKEAGLQIHSIEAVWTPFDPLHESDFVGSGVVVLSMN